MRWLRHAFAIDSPGPVEPTPEQQRIIDRLVKEIHARGLVTPAILMLETSRPLNYITSQFLVFISPIAQAIFDAGSYKALTEFLAQRGSIETLCQEIEKAEQRDNSNSQHESNSHHGLHFQGGSNSQKEHSDA